MNTTIRHARTLAVGAATALAFAGHAAASELYAVDFNPLGTVYTLNQATGAISTVGGTTVASSIGDLTSNPATNTIWGVEIVNTSTSNLHILDRLTGASSGFVGVNTGPNEPLSITSIAYDTVSGKLFGNTTPAYSGVVSDELYEINPLTGLATLIGRITFDNVFALGFDNTGALYGITGGASEFIKIDTTSGLGALVADLADGTYFDIAARPEDNTLFVTNTFGGAPAYSLLTIAGDGTLTTIGGFGPADVTNVVGLAFTTAEIPEPSSYALVIAGLLGLITIARRRPS